MPESRTRSLRARRLKIDPGEPVSQRAPQIARVRLHPHGLELPTGGPHTERASSVLPLYAGSMHYWRHHPSTWAAGLDAMREMGLLLVDTYVPWGVHEREPGVYDFGTKEPRHDVGRFLRMAHERGLRAVVRPGPHINAELTYFGLPERIVWDRACQARTPRDNPVMLPIVPVAFPVPSYASRVFHAEVERWFDRVAKELAPLRYPEGPIVLVQIDNEGALYFRDGAYDQDYHPDAIVLFRRFLRGKYRTPRELRAAWGQSDLSFSTVTPPVRFEATTADDLVRHMDWMEFHEHLLAGAMQRMARTLVASGFDGLPTMHNFPLAEAVTPLNAGRIELDLIGLDYYHRATPQDHVAILRRTSELVSRCAGMGAPPYGAEVGAGFPPFFSPLTEDDSIYTLMAAMAYGLRGYNLYMAVERDRWVGAPIDPQGRRRPFADRFEALSRALEQTRFHTLTRRAPVRLVVPRSLRRLARATHAFGPMTPAMFHVIGAGFRESCLEDDFGLGGGAPTLDAEAYLRAFERALSARGVPFAYAGGETFDVSTRDARWLICATAGGVKRELWASLLLAANTEGTRVTVGPRIPDRDGSLRRLDVPYERGAIELEPLEEMAQADSLVARRIEELALPTYPHAPDDIFVAVHEDERGTAKVAFFMNPTAAEVSARVALPGAGALVDLMAPRARRIARTAGGFDLVVPPHTVRMMAIES
ncbi:beta-galactosidase [Pendulispora rubella]|uniref:Beta-galactosidase n=1 Tax=Pendulispora rubella TaxID=2741070 RepID=A0ABZ2L0C1_9BACT